MNEQETTDAPREPEAPPPRPRPPIGGLLTLAGGVLGLGAAFVFWLAMQDAEDTAGAAVDQKDAVVAAAGPLCDRPQLDTEVQTLCSEVQEAERNPVDAPDPDDPDPNDPEYQDQEQQDPENQDAEQQDGDPNDPDPNDPEIQDSESNDPDPFDDPDPNDPDPVDDTDPNDPDPVDDPDPNDPSPACPPGFTAQERTVVSQPGIDPPVTETWWACVKNEGDAGGE